MKKLLLSITFLGIVALNASAATNVALNQPISCTSAVLPAAKANDGNRTTYWQGGNVTFTSCTITLPSVQPIGQHMVQMPIGNTFSVSQQMEIWRSTDGYNWYEVLHKGTSSFNYCDGSSASPYACAFSYSSGQGNEWYAKYWRINMWQRTKNGVVQPGAQLGEVILNRL